MFVDPEHRGRGLARAILVCPPLDLLTLIKTDAIAPNLQTSLGQTRIVSCEDGKAVVKKDIEALASWDPKATPDKPVGTVCFAACGPGTTRTTTSAPSVSAASI